jgi:hypothetical protein
MRVQVKESNKVDSVILPRRAFLKGHLGLVAAPAVVRAESLMPIVPWRPTFWYSHGGGMNFLACRKADLIGVDLTSLGLPSPGWDGGSKSSRVRLWSYWSHPLGSLPRDKVRVPDHQRQLRDIEATRIAAGLPHYYFAKPSS